MAISDHQDFHRGSVELDMLYNDQNQRWDSGYTFVVSVVDYVVVVADALTMVP